MGHVIAAREGVEVGVDSQRFAAAYVAGSSRVSVASISSVGELVTMAVERLVLWRRAG